MYYLDICKMQCMAEPIGNKKINGGNYYEQV